MSKKLLILFAIVFFRSPVTAQENDSIDPNYKRIRLFLDSIGTCYVKYRHVLINYGNGWQPHTEVTSEFAPYKNLRTGFHYCSDFQKDVMYWTGGACHRKCVELTGVDTVNSLYWPYGTNDSLHEYRKNLYSFMLDKFGEERLNIDTVKKIRLLLPSYYLNTDSWDVIKVLSYDDSAVLIRKRMDYPYYDRIETVTGKISLRKRQKLIKEIELLNRAGVYECVSDNHYYPLIEYFDGYSERTFIFPKKCLSDKEIYKRYEKVIVLLWNLRVR